MLIVQSGADRLTLVPVIWRHHYGICNSRARESLLILNCLSVQEREPRLCMCAYPCFLLLLDSKELIEST